MKYLVKKTTKIGVDEDGNGKGITYRQLIINCLNDVPSAPSGQPIGFSRSEMKDRDAIEKAVEESEDDEKSFLFEDAVANNLKRIVSSMKWAMRHEDLLEFIDAVDNMEKVKKKKKKKTNEIEEEAKKKESEEDIEDAEEVEESEETKDESEDGEE